MNLFKKKYLEQKDLEEFRARQQMINQHLLVVEGLKTLLSIWAAQKLKEYGFDNTKKYEIDVKSGKITEVKWTTILRKLKRR